MVERWLKMEGLVGGDRLVGGGVFPLPPPSAAPPTPEERLLSDVWVYVTLALMAVSCVGCVCSCLLYHKFQQWKHHARGRSCCGGPLRQRRVALPGLIFPGGGAGDSGSSFSSDAESPRDPDEDSLPSYTLVTGLPTYEQAMEQLREAKKLSTLSVSGLLETAYSPPAKS